MGAWSDIVKAYHEASRPIDKSKPRDLTDDDRSGWADAQDSLQRNMKPRTIEDVQALIRKRNPMRWRQTQSNFRWVQKEMKKMGLNPEDARYIL